MSDDPFRRAVDAHRAGNFEAAEQGYLALARYRNAARNLAVLYNQWSRFEQAESWFRRILVEYPDDPAAAFSLSMLLLKLERYDEAWPLYEARTRVGLSSVPLPALPYPEWRGDRVNGPLVVLCEQGFGDQILFARYLPLLKGDVVVACRPAMVRLFEQGGFQAVTEAPATAGAWTRIGSLPLRLGTLAPAVPYGFGLSASLGQGVGVVPTGDPIHPNDQNRSASPVAATRLLRFGRDLRPEATGVRDLLDTAKIVAQLGMVVTVDTVVANLAPSLGVPTTVLLPFIGADWRWGIGERSPWFPNARLLRQNSPGDWTSLLDQINSSATQEL